MRLPDQLRRTIAYFHVKKADGEMVPIGTCVLVKKTIDEDPVAKAAARTSNTEISLTRGFNYLVTAKHVVEKAASLGVSEIFVRMNKKLGGSAYEPCELKHFIHDPDPQVDLAAVALLPDDQDDLMSLRFEEIYPLGLAKGDDVGVGSAVSIVGMFRYHLGTERNLPIVRTGNIAAMPEEPVRTAKGLMEAMLIEARSLGGLSGSPVFVNLGQVFVVDGELGVATRPRTLLLGIMHGHFDEVGIDVKERVNVGIGIVIPGQKIIDLLSLPHFLDAEAAATKQYRTRSDL